MVCFRKTGPFMMRDFAKNEEKKRLIIDLDSAGDVTHSRRERVAYGAS